MLVCGAALGKALERTLECLSIVSVTLLALFCGILHEVKPSLCRLCLGLCMA